MCRSVDCHGNVSQPRHICGHVSVAGELYPEMADTTVSVPGATRDMDPLETVSPIPAYADIPQLTLLSTVSDKDVDK